MKTKASEPREGLKDSPVINASDIRQPTQDGKLLTPSEDTTSTTFPAITRQASPGVARNRPELGHNVKRLLRTYQFIKLIYY
jgi:hypothetical protein